MKKNKAFNIGCLSLPLSMFIIINSHAEWSSVNGSIVTTTEPVQNAAITFIDNSDTTRQFSARTNSSGDYSIRIKTTINHIKAQPTSFSLEQNYPNPFFSSTAISYKLSTPEDVQVTIFDVLGREVTKMSMGTTQAGSYQTFWNGLDTSGERVAPGVYFYRLQAGDRVQAKKMILVEKKTEEKMI